MKGFLFQQEFHQSQTSLDMRAIIRVRVSQLKSLPKQNSISFKPSRGALGPNEFDLETLDKFLLALDYSNRVPNSSQNNWFQL